MNYEKVVLRETQFYRGGWVGGVEKLQLLQGGHTARIMSSCPEMRLKKQNKKLHSMNSFFSPQFLCLWVLECIRRKTSLCSVLGENRAPETLLEISCACHPPWDRSVACEWEEMVSSKCRCVWTKETKMKRKMMLSWQNCLVESKMFSVFGVNSKHVIFLCVWKITWSVL